MQSLVSGDRGLLLPDTFGISIWGQKIPAAAGWDVFVSEKKMAIEAFMEMPTAFCKETRKRSAGDSSHA